MEETNKSLKVVPDKYMERRLEEVVCWARHAGKSHYIRYLQGRTMSRAMAMSAKCYECGGGMPCVCTTCPLFAFSPKEGEDSDGQD